MRRTVRRTITLALLAALALGAALAWPRYLLKLRCGELRQAVGAVQLALERYAVDHQGAYPPDLEALLRQGYLSRWPDNPFGPGGLVPLRPGDPWQPGGILYLAWGPVIYQEHNGENGVWLFPEWAEGTALPRENDQYLLIAYSPRRHPARARSLAAARAEYAAAQRQLALGQNPGAVPLYADGVDWLYAEVVLTAGEDQPFPR